MKLENRTEIITNNIKGSILEITLHRVSFKELWDKYPSEKINHINTKTKKDEFINHCAINISETLYQNGIKLKSFEGVKCYHKCPTGKNIHVIRAQELADWLKKRPFAGCPKPLELKGNEFREKLNNRTGIIFFKDYWQRNNETGEIRTGDHIDLWDGKGIDKLASQNILENFFTNTLGVYIDGIYSNKNKSKQVLFWEIA